MGVRYQWSFAWVIGSFCGSGMIHTSITGSCKCAHDIAGIISAAERIVHQPAVSSRIAKAIQALPKLEGIGAGAGERLGKVVASANKIACHPEKPRSSRLCHYILTPQSPPSRSYSSAAAGLAGR